MNLNKDEILEKVKMFSWYHIIDVGHGIKTPGYNNLNLQQAVVNKALARVDFKEKKVLDIGCRDGMYCFDAEKRGASEIIGIDSMISKGATEFLIPYFNSKVKMYEMSLFELTPEKFGLFDVIIFPGVLYHLRYPFSALKIMRTLLKPNGIMIMETAVLRSFSFSRLEKLALLYCPIGKESPYEETSVTFYNTKGLIDSLTSLSFDTISINYMYDDERRKNLTIYKRFKLFILKLYKGYTIDRITTISKASNYSETGVANYWNKVYSEQEIIDLKNPDNR